MSEAQILLVALNAKYIFNDPEDTYKDEFNAEFEKWTETLDYERWSSRLDKDLFAQFLEFYDRTVSF